VENMGEKLSTFVGPVKCKNCGHVFNKEKGVTKCPKCSRDILAKEIDDTILERD
jgi:predicted Zn-ribbon and HTH transcriptional regulator